MNPYYDDYSVSAGLEEQFYERFLVAARKPERLVNRLAEMDCLREAILNPKAGNGLEIVFLMGPGGMGKSRIAEEVLWRAGNSQMRAKMGPIPLDHPDWDWTTSALIISPNLLDMSYTSYHFSQRFMQAIKESLVKANPALDFLDYDNAYLEYQQRVIWRVGDQKVIDAAKFAEQSFFKCYQNAAEKVDRLVLSLDTCERLSYTYTDWLEKENLLDQKELPYLSHWLLSRIQEGAFPNTTLLLVGRYDDQGRSFFDLIEQGVDHDEQTHKIHLQKLSLSGFNFEETCDYFSSLADTWKQVQKKYPQYEYLANDFQMLATDQERLKVLWLYTAGQPVRLALYCDLIVEGRSLPEQLLYTPEKAGIELQNEDLEEIQKSIESSFVYLLFGEQGLRAGILTFLARAPRGLNAEQLYYLLHSEPLGEKPDPEQLQLIEKELLNLSLLAIVKIRPDGRLGLQDEVYKIYAHVLASHSQSRLDEQAARKKTYHTLERYAVQRRDAYRKKRWTFYQEDERLLVVSDPTRSHRLIFPQSSGIDQERRNQAHDEIDRWEKEVLHYRLLGNLSETVNIVVFELTYNNFKANHPDDFSDMEEVYQVIYDDNLLHFIDLPPNPRNEPPIKVMRRFLMQAEVSRWLSRFVIHKKFGREKQFLNDVEKYVENLVDEADKHSWTHTLSAAERQCWHEYGRILNGEEISDALIQLTKISEKLTRLANTSKNEEALPGEHGFIDHPGLERVKRVLSHAYNSLGYGYVTIGKLRTSIKCYSQALAQLRTIESRVQMSTILTNLSRALSDIGRLRARRVCLDAVELRKEMGELVPIAYSLNTLALIDNDQLRPDLAWVEAATAAAYFRQTGDRRGLGLALIQLGEALRRLVGKEGSLGRALPPDPEKVYQAAEQTLDEAIRIFSTEPEKQEEVRLIEAKIELGCLQRDRLLRISDPSIKEYTYNAAKGNLLQAAEMAKKYGYLRHTLDAKVNQAWTNYAFGQVEKAEEDLRQAEMMIPSDRFIKEDQIPKLGQDDSFVFQQLSKMHGLRGIMAMDAFMEVEKELPIPNDLSRSQRHTRILENPVVRNHLNRAATNYVLAISYAQLFSPRSGALSAIYDQLYNFLKGFNDQELKLFDDFQKEERERYRLDRLVLEDLGDLGVFLRECIGDI
jgi:hypothetical protein